jgi:hypothetical protein
MERKRKIEDEVEKTLTVLDGMENARQNPFLYTRIKAKLESKKDADQSSKPILLPVSLVLLVLLNIFTLFNTQLTGNQDQSSISQQYLQELGNEYNLYETNYYSYNIE